MNALRFQPLSRRTVLRGLGASIALPWLESMMPRAFASGAPVRHPVRMAFMYVPNGIQMGQWTPTTEGARFELPPLLTPLAAVRDDINVLTGLAALEGRMYGDGGNHAPAMGSFLTGVHPTKAPRCGISADQLAAARIGHQTRLPTLELSCHRTGRPSCDKYPCVVTSTMSWASPTQPLPTEGSPRAIFDRLFRANDQRDRQRINARRSILDTVREEANSLSSQVSSNDRHRVEEYLTSIRDIEQRIARAESIPAPRLPEGTVRPEERMPNDFAQYVRILGDLMVLAFQTDVTRICTLIFDSEGSNRSYQEIGVRSAHHDLSHHNNNEAMVRSILQIERYHVTQLAYIIDRLKRIREGEGTLLDNCMIAYGCGLGDGNRHDHFDLPILLAGKGGGAIRSGRHIRYPQNTPVTNLWLAMLDRAGAAAPRLGDSTGLLNGLS